MAAGSVADLIQGRSLHEEIDSTPLEQQAQLSQGLREARFEAAGRIARKRNGAIQAYNKTGEEVLIASGMIEELETPVHWPNGLKAVPSDEVLEHVIRNAGARPADRDEVDQRIIQDLMDRKGRVIDSQSEVGGYPKAEPVRKIDYRVDPGRRSYPFLGRRTRDRREGADPADF